ncbi:MAG: hypothetical protein DCF18_05525 [Cyanobium sp.]|nr:hypothetical protein [Synechococcus sp. CS-1333]PZV23675.1 MAG: hypothetical protein DCF18_05525 [Cyanobium sp.]
MGLASARAWSAAAALVVAALGLSACRTTPGETPAQQAKVGDLLVRAGTANVTLAKAFVPGQPNGLYKGVVRVQTEGQPDSSARLYQVNAVCSIENEPNWPTYDNLYGNELKDLVDAGKFSTATRWQILYYFDGGVDSTGVLSHQAWTDRLKDNLCRRGTFNDSTARPAT